MNIDAMYPPENSIFVGGGDFRGIGEMICGMIREYAGLNADDHILDVGCGIGRVAIPLTQVLSAEGRYEGFDIMPEGIKWCQERITPLYPNFKFQVASLRNDFYTKGARKKAENFVFPYNDNSFNLIILTSVFTHLLATPMENYLAQISRVLEIGGRTFITYYLRTDEAVKGIESGNSTLDFNNYRDGCWIADPARPEAAVCFDPSHIEALYEKYGFEIEKRVLSDWHSVKGSGAQDILVGRKVRDVAISDRSHKGLLEGLKRMIGMSR